MSRHIDFQHYGAIHVMCLFWNKRHVAFTIITFVSRLSDNCFYPFLIREPNSNCLTCLYRFNRQHQTMFHENAVGWHARMEIVHTICLEVAIGPKKFFWKVEFVQKYFGYLNFTLKKAWGFSHHGTLHILCYETTSYLTCMESFWMIILHSAG